MQPHPATQQYFAALQQRGPTGLHVEELQELGDAVDQREQIEHDMVEVLPDEPHLDDLPRPRHSRRELVPWNQRRAWPQAKLQR